MPGCWSKGRLRLGSVQAKCGLAPAGVMLAVGLAAGLALGGCSDPLSAPVDLFHDLQGGEIAAHRPPAPGAGQHYPKLGTVPAKPVLPATAYRNGLAA